jgi:hypothetical protein
MPQIHLAPVRAAITQAVLEHVERNNPLLVLKAPPGSGKTFTATHAVALSAHRHRRVAVGTQTNAQADDFCRRMAREFPKFPVVRFGSSTQSARFLGDSITWKFKSKELPAGTTIVVANTAKWASTDFEKIEPFDLLLIDEAWQMCWADFMLMSHVAGRFILVGDPGQIAPIVPIDVSRWQTSRRPPHRAAPDVILRDRTLPTLSLELPLSTRLPFDTVEIVRAFYDFHFDSWAAPAERRLVVDGAKPGVSRGVDGAIDLLTTGSVALLTLPTPDTGPPLEEDTELAQTAADLVRRLLSRKASVITEDGPAALGPSDIGLSAPHRVMNTRIQDALGPLAREIRVDTPERWQGLERKIMVVIHPLSGIVAPSTFDLSTGRLCVMTSRHSVGLILLARDHVGPTLDELLPAATQAVGLPDEAGKGHAQNLKVWRWLEQHGRRVDASEPELRPATGSLRKPSTILALSWSSRLERVGQAEAARWTIFLSYGDKTMPPPGQDADFDYSGDAIREARRTEILAMGFDPDLFLEATALVDWNRIEDAIEETRQLPDSWATVADAEEARSQMTAQFGATEAEQEAARRKLTTGKEED